MARERDPGGRSGRTRDRAWLTRDRARPSFVPGEDDRVGLLAGSLHVALDPVHRQVKVEHCRHQTPPFFHGALSEPAFEIGDRKKGNLVQEWLRPGKGSRPNIQVPGRVSAHCIRNRESMEGSVPGMSGASDALADAKRQESAFPIVRSGRFVDIFCLKNNNFCLFNDN